MYEVVREAQQTAIERVEAGMTGADAHALAASVIEEHGYGDAFTHGLGHGVGLDVHDYPPYLGPTSTDVLEDGMVFHHRARHLPAGLGWCPHRGYRDPRRRPRPPAQHTRFNASSRSPPLSQISTSEFRRGVTIEMNDKLYAVLSYEHNKTARGSAQVRMKLRDVRSGAIIEHTVQAGTRFDRARVERRDMQYLYADEDFYYFMNTETYDQIPVDVAKVGDAAKFLKENDVCEVALYGEEVIAVELPGSVALTVAATDPGHRGDTAQGGSKPATLETGLVVQVPLFISEGEVIRVNTETGEYIERAN